jgi:cytochrome c-type biogenesis protein
MMKRYIAAFAASLLVLSLAACSGLRTVPGKTTPAASPGVPAASGSLSSDEALIATYTKQLRNTPSTDFTLKDLNGKQWKLSDLKGKIVLLNFWATWCGPCQSEMPDFQNIYSKIGGNGDVVILAVSSDALEQLGADKSLDAVSQFVKKQGFTFPVLFDADGKVWSKYQQDGIPANYILDRQSNIRLLLEGAFRDEKSLYAALEAVRRADSGQ